MSVASKIIMRYVWRIVAVLGAGCAVGVLATSLTVQFGRSGNVSNGPWRTNLTVGSPLSDPYTRAFVAIHALFAMTRNEAIYYIADTDGDGRGLDGTCRYLLTGVDPDARWWTITAYGPDGYLISNAAHRYSVSKNSIMRDTAGRFVIQIAADARGSNGISVDSGPFSLMLRLYNPRPDVSLDPARAVLPLVRRESCP